MGQISMEDLAQLYYGTGQRLHTFQHAITQIPYALIAAFVSIIGYLILGYA